MKTNKSQLAHRVDPQHTQAVSLLAAGQYEQAVSVLLQALQRTPGSPWLLRRLADAWQGCGRNSNLCGKIDSVFRCKLPHMGDKAYVGGLCELYRQAGLPALRRLALARYCQRRPEDSSAQQELAANVRHYAELYHGFEQGLHGPPTFSDNINRPLFSVITPSFNQAAYIEDTIRAVLWQGIPSFEHIVVDGGSTDGTLEILQRYPHLRWISEPDKGQSDALNKGLRLARGEIVAWINSDDFHLPGAFQAVSDWFAAHPRERLVMGDCLWIFERTGRQFVLMNQEKNFEDLLQYWDDFVHPSQQSLFFKRDLLDEVGLIDQSLHYGMDCDLWLRMTQKQPIRYLPRVLAAYRFHDQAKGSSGDCWEPFYPDFKTIFARYCSLSQNIPHQGPLLSIALPLRKERPQEAAQVRAVIERISQDVFREIEFLICTDSDNPEQLVPADCSHAPIRFVSLDKEDFAAAAARQAQGAALHFPSLADPLPRRWYALRMNDLLGCEALAGAADEGVSMRPHELMPSGPAFGPQVVHRTRSVAHLARRTAASPLLSVIIPTFERAGALEQCLDALADQTLDAKDYEVIVCDDGSTDRTAELLAGQERPYRLMTLRQDQRRGPSAARNRAIAQASGRWLLFINDDTILHPDGLAIHTRYQALHQTSDQSGAGGIAVLGRTYFPPAFTCKPTGYVLEYSDLYFDFARSRSNQFYPYPHFYTCNISVGRRAVLDAGGFDEAFTGPGAEDIELAWRLYGDDPRILYLWHLAARHEHHLSVRDFCRAHAVRGAGGVIRLARHAQVGCHYLDMPPQRAQELRNELETIGKAEVAELLQALEALDKECVPDMVLCHANFYDRPTAFPLGEEADDSEELPAYMGIWRMRAADIAAECTLLSGQIRDLRGKDRFLERAGLQQVYQALDFLRWFHDTQGIVNSPWLEQFYAVRNIQAA